MEAHIAGIKGFIILIESASISRSEMATFVGSVKTETRITPSRPAALFLCGVNTPMNRLFFLAIVAAALLMLAFFTRLFPISVQDRVIRLEQKLRLCALLPAEQHAQIDALTLKQLIAIRFAADDEAEELVAFCHANPGASSDDVKKRIRVWVADSLRI